MEQVEFSIDEDDHATTDGQMLLGGLMTTAGLTKIKWMIIDDLQGHHPFQGKA